MNAFACVRFRSKVVTAAVAIVGLGSFALAAVTPAFAIPSPELVVGSFTSVSQLIALASAVIGGGATLAAMRRLPRTGAQAVLSRGLIALVTTVVLLLVTSIGVNIYQYLGHKSERQARLEQTLLRQATTPGGPKLDPANLELSYAQMIKQPRGISTDDTQKLLEAAARGERNDLLFLDVRETAERDMGAVPGATFVRFPDFKAAKIDFTGKQAIFFCHNGNRSWETCEELAKQGIDCRFVVGGLEKWIVEGRPFTGLKTRTLADLRAIPDYRNHNVLLDTPDVHKLVSNEGALFVDARYAEEFAAGHLPGAINLTIRATPSAELPAKLTAIPKKPIILPCYDRRGCFFSEVLGLELTRAGHDFRGRYTLPWEYFPPRGRPPHVDQWAKEISASIWIKAGRHIASVISELAQWTGLIGAIVLLAIISRLLVLPVSAKAERDQIRLRAFSSELEALKSRLTEDPMRRARAIRAFYRRHGLTPLRNSVALLFLPIMAIALLGVQQAVSKSEDHVLWLSNLAQRDPWLILPILFATLTTLYLDMAFVQSARQRIIVWAISLPLLTATGALFSAGADIYLVTSAMLLLLQRMFVAGVFGRLWRAWRRGLRAPRIIALDDPDRLAGRGQKAFRLARMRAEKMPVPRGLVLPSDFLEEFASQSPEWRGAQVDEIWRRLGKQPLAARSATDAEDGRHRSFAGIFESILDVDRHGLEAAILQVRASFGSERAKTYGGVVDRGSVLIQHMIAADYAGVLFTQDPAAGGLSMIELVPGTAQGLMSGSARPHSYRFGRVSGQLMGEETPPIDLGPLLVLGQQAEALFAAPQDVEWTWRDGQFYIVQSRDITSQIPPVQRHLAGVLDLAKAYPPDEIAFAKNELSEMLPRPTRLSLSLMEALWASGGSVDLASRALGLSYPVEEEAPSYLVTVLGRLYVHKVQERQRALKISPFAARRLMRVADAIEREFRQTFLPKFLAEVRIAEAVDFDKLSTPDLYDAIERIYDRFVYETHVEVDIINVAANLYLSRARKLLTRRGLDPSSYLGHIPETFEARALAEAARAAPDERRLMLLANFGHRAALDYELSEPRYAESPQRLDDFTSLHRGPVVYPQPHSSGDPASVKVGKTVAHAIETARRFQALKEDARHHSLRELAVLRRAILALDRRLGLGGLSFFLRFDELLSIHTQPADLWRSLAEQRQRERAVSLEHASPAATLTARDLEVISMGGQTVQGAFGGRVRGMRVSGSGIVTGRARVIPDADAECGRPIEPFEDGDIIVASMIHPGWLPYFERAGGFVSEVGGWLSHAAILAREYNTTMIVGARNLGSIADRSLLRLHPDGIIETVGDDELLRAIAAE
jgi:rhodanese-related sulfurtransferase/phosphohistidine swiveling domain-containing protein